jgi:hypothetical protein
MSVALFPQLCVISQAMHLWLMLCESRLYFYPMVNTRHLTKDVSCAEMTLSRCANMPVM